VHLFCAFFRFTHWEGKYKYFLASDPVQLKVLHFYEKQKNPSTSVSKIECDLDKTICHTDYCRLKAIARGKSWLHFGCVTNYPLYDTKVSETRSQFSSIFNLSFLFQTHVKHFVKTSKNIFMPGFFDMTFDACKFSDFADNILIAKLFPNAREMFKHYNHPCPFVVGLLNLLKIFFFSTSSFLFIG
jgi:hypothetical protein